MFFVGRFVSLKESFHYDETPFAPCACILIPTQLVAKNMVHGDGTDVAWYRPNSEPRCDVAFVKYSKVVPADVGPM